MVLKQVEGLTILLMHVNCIVVQIDPLLKKKELPSVRRFTTLDEKFLDDCKRMLNDYLSVSDKAIVQRDQTSFIVNARV